MYERDERLDHAAPCPFCGSKDLELGRLENCVHCLKCLADGPEIILRKHDRERIWRVALDAWNHRFPLIEELNPAQYKQERDEVKARLKALEAARTEAAHIIRAKVFFKLTPNQSVEFERRARAWLADVGLQPTQSSPAATSETDGECQACGGKSCKHCNALTAELATELADARTLLSLAMNQIDGERGSINHDLNKRIADFLILKREYRLTAGEP